jgi:hypothetical protein
MSRRRRIIARGGIRQTAVAEKIEVPFDDNKSEEEMDPEEVLEITTDKDHDYDEEDDGESEETEVEKTEEPEESEEKMNAEEEMDILALKRKLKAKKSIMPSHLDENTEVVTEKPVLRKKGVNPMADILENMKVGTIIMVLREAADSWKVTVTDKRFSDVVHPNTTNVRLSGRAYWDTVSNPDYVLWSKEWNQLTFSEKKKRAQKLGVTWEANRDPKIETMLLTAAVREKLGIKKYRPEFSSRAARSNIRARS